jgi:heat-inducible transcriptional repressor
MRQTLEISGERDLNERSREMLTLLVETHVSTGEPVGSRTISKLSRERLSAATVRNVMSDLEECGYLGQPHTSAGRIPTDKCYRFYVDHILESTSLSEEDETLINRWLTGQDWTNPERLMSRASSLLSQLSDNVGIVISPGVSQDVIKHIEFLRLNDGRILVITVSRAGLVQDRIIRLDESFNQDELDRTARYVNTNFAGMTLVAIRTELLRQISEEKALYDRLLMNAARLCDLGFREDSASDTETDAEVFIEGASRFFTKPDFANAELMRDLFRMFEEKGRVVRLLTECLEKSLDSAVRIRIGGENSLPLLHSCAVVTSTWSYGDQVVGSLGVVGPMRMQYARMINVVHYVARLLEQSLSGTMQTTNN